MNNKLMKKAIYLFLIFSLTSILYGESQLKRELLQSFINWQTLETSYIEEYVILGNQQSSLSVSNISVYIDIRSGYYKKIISNFKSYC